MYFSGFCKHFCNSVHTFVNTNGFQNSSMLDEEMLYLFYGLFRSTHLCWSRTYIYRDGHLLLYTAFRSPPLRLIQCKYHRKSIIWARHPIVKLRSGCKCIVLMMLWHEPSGLRCKLHRWFTNLLLIIFVCVGFLTPKYVFS